MGETIDISSVIINGDKETVWKAITDEDLLTKWYVPGSPWKIPSLNIGEKVTFTLMPSVHNNLTEKLPMSLTIENVNPYKEFSLYLHSYQMLISIMLVEEINSTRVTINSGGYEQSLANLKALIEGDKIPYI